MTRAAILVVGDEILAGEVTDRNGALVLSVLPAAGVPVVRLVAVPDREEDIVDELGRLRALADVVIVSGGIGPTHDDVTRPAVARALGVPLETHPDAERRIRAWYADRATDAELGMGVLPAGARLLPGERTGTFGFEIGGVHVLPGVPLLFADILKPLAATLPARTTYREVLSTGRREGEIAPSLAAVQGRSPDVAIGSYPVLEDGRWHVRVVLRAIDPDRLAAVAREVRAVL